MALTIKDLGMVCEAVYVVRTKAYNMGLLLKVDVDTLDSIEDRYNDPGNKLREVLKAWLKTATKATWQDILGALKTHLVGQPKLASEIEDKYCTAVETGQASGQMTLVAPAVLPQQPTTRDTQLKTLQQALQDSRELRNKDQQERCMDTLHVQQELQDSQKLIQHLIQQVKDKQHTIDDRETQIHDLTWQLEAVKQDLLQHQQTSQELQAANGRLKWELQQAMKNKLAGQWGTIRDMKWQKESIKAPDKMLRGSAASDCNMAYFNDHDSTTVHSYDSNTQKWCQLPDTPLTQSTIVVVEHILTMVGGYLSCKVTDSLLSLMGEGGTTKWLPHFPAMPTARRFPAAVCSGHSLIVAGGEGDGDNKLATVEVLHTDTRQWSTACSLPHPVFLATISICDDRLYLMAAGPETRSVLTCSIHELLQSQTQPLAGKLRTAPATQTTKWWQVADAPHSLSSCATLCGQLVAVGGWEGDKNSTAIFVYKETTDSWEVLVDMPTARRMALVVILNGKLMVVGGRVGGSGWWLRWTVTDVVEILC